MNNLRHSGPRIEYGSGFELESRGFRRQGRSMWLALLESRFRRPLHSPLSFRVRL